LGYGLGTTSVTEQEPCVHQCIQCAVMYQCEKNKCKMPFLSGRCNICQNGFFGLNFSLSWSIKLVASIWVSSK